MNKNRQKLLYYTGLILLVILIVGVQLVSISIAKNVLLDNIVMLKRRELSELYSIYSNMESQAKSRIELLAGTDIILENAQIIDSLSTDDDDFFVKVDHFANIVSDYCSQMDIFLITNRYIIHVYKIDNEVYHTINKTAYGEFFGLYDGIDFSNKISRGTYNMDIDPINMRTAIVAELKNPEYILVGLPNYNQYLGNYKSEITILDKNGYEKLFLNTTVISTLISGTTTYEKEDYKVIKTGTGEYLLCYYYPQGMGYDYCMSIVDYDMATKSLQKQIYLTWIVCAVLFIIMGVIYHYWSISIMKPMAYFNDIMDLTFNIKDLKNISIEDWFPKSGYNLHVRLNAYYLSVAIPVLVVGIVSIIITSYQMNMEMETYYHSLMKQSAISTEIELENARQHASILSSDKEIHEILSAEGNTLSPYSQQLISHILFSKEIVDYNIKSIRIIDLQENVIYSSSRNYGKANSYILALKAAQQWLWVLDGGIESPILYYRITSKKLNDENESIDVPLGYMEISYGDIISDRLNAASADNPIQAYIIDSMNEMYKISGSLDISDDIISQLRSINDEQAPYKLVNIQGDQVMLSSSYLQVSGFTMAYLIPVEQYLRGHITENILIYILMLTIVAVSAVISGTLMSEVIIKPFRQLRNAITDADIKVNLDETLYGKNEFRLLANRFNKMMNRLNSYSESLHNELKQRHDLEARRREAEILALQTQINPHFLYNIFTSIAVLIRSGETDKAAQMVMDTGNLMRVGLYKGSVMVELREEVDHINKYIKLQQIRYHNRVAIAFDIEEKLLDYRVLKFILQPLVENCIEHGLEENSDNVLHIKISAKADTDFYIFIEDDGKMLTEHKIDYLQDKIDNFDMDEHIGLVNVNERIKLNCSNEYGIKLSSIGTGGMCVEIHLPII